MALNKTVKIVETISNISVTMITITEDKLVNILTAHISKIKKAGDWLASASFFVSLLLTYVSADFHSAFGLSADTIKGIFLAVMAASAIYCVRTICRSLKNKDDVGDIMKDIKSV